MASSSSAFSRRMRTSRDDETGLGDFSPDHQSGSTNPRSPPPTSSSSNTSLHSHFQGLKLKLKLQNSTKQKLNRLINRTLLIPSALFAEFNGSLSSSSYTTESEPSAGHSSNNSDNTVNNFGMNGQTTVTLTLPPESYSHSSVNGTSRSRQDSITSILTAASDTNSFLAIPGGDQTISQGVGASSSFGFPSLTRLSSWTSHTSSAYKSILTSASETLMSKDRVLGEAESGVAFLNDESLQCGPKFDFVEVLPSEIVDQILSYLSISQLSSCCLVSKSWKGVAESNSVWRKLFHNQLHWSTLDQMPKDVCWKDIYKIRLILERRWHSGTHTPKALPGHSDSVYCVQFNQDYIVTGSRDRTIKIWNAKSGKIMKTLGIESKEANTRETLSREASSRDVGSRERSSSIVAVNGAVGSIGASSTSTSEDPVSSSKPHPIAHVGSVLCLDFDRHIMVSGSSDSSCIVWDMKKFKPIKQVYRHSAGVLDICLDETHVVSCSKDSTICVWNRHDTSFSLERRLVGHHGPVNSVQMRGDFVVSAGGDALVKLWSISTGACLRDFRGHTRGLACVQLSADATVIVSGGNDNLIRIWDVRTGECKHILEGHKSLIRSIHLFSGKIVSGSYDQTIKVWDVETGNLISDLTGWHGSWIFSAKADCKRIISTSLGIKPVLLDYSEGLDKKILDLIRS